MSAADERGAKRDAATAGEDVFVAHVRASLDAGLQGQDVSTLARLRAARHDALAATPHRASWPLLAAAAMACAVLVLALGVQREPAPQTPALDDVDMLAGSDPLELYQELEFYAWLALDEPTG